VCGSDTTTIKSRGVVMAEKQCGSVKITITNSNNKAATASASTTAQQKIKTSSNGIGRSSMRVSHFLDASFRNFESNKHVILTPSYMMHRQAQVQATAQQDKQDSVDNNDGGEDDDASRQQRAEHHLLPHRVIVLLLILHDLSEVIHYFLRVAKAIIFGYGYALMVKMYSFLPEELRLKIASFLSSIFAANAAGGMNVNTNAWSLAYYSYMGKNAPPPAFAGLAVLTLIALIVHPDGLTWIILGKLWNCAKNSFVACRENISNLREGKLPGFLASESFVGLVLIVALIMYVHQATTETDDRNTRQQRSSRKDKGKKGKHKGRHHQRAAHAHRTKHRSHHPSKSSSGTARTTSHAEDEPSSLDATAGAKSSDSDSLVLSRNRISTIDAICPGRKKSFDSAEADNGSDLSLSVNSLQAAPHAATITSSIIHEVDSSYHDSQSSSTVLNAATSSSLSIQSSGSTSGGSSSSRKNTGKASTTTNYHQSHHTHHHNSKRRESQQQRKSRRSDDDVGCFASSSSSSSAPLSPTYSRRRPAPASSNSRTMTTHHPPSTTIRSNNKGSSSMHPLAAGLKSSAFISTTTTSTSRSGTAGGGARSKEKKEMTKVAIPMNRIQQQQQYNPNHFAIGQQHNTAAVAVAAPQSIIQQSRIGDHQVLQQQQQQQQSPIGSSTTTTAVKATPSSSSFFGAGNATVRYNIPNYKGGYYGSSGRYAPGKVELAGFLAHVGLVGAACAQLLADVADVDALSRFSNEDYEQYGIVDREKRARIQVLLEARAIRQAQAQATMTMAAPCLPQHQDASNVVAATNTNNDYLSSRWNHHHHDAAHYHHHPHPAIIRPPPGLGLFASRDDELVMDNGADGNAVNVANCSSPPPIGVPPGVNAMAACTSPIVGSSLKTTATNAASHHSLQQQQQQQQQTLVSSSRSVRSDHQHPPPQPNIHVHDHYRGCSYNVGGLSQSQTSTTSTACNGQHNSSSIKSGSMLMDSNINNADGNTDDESMIEADLLALGDQMVGSILDF